jgi:hypothetical protein
MNIDKKKNTTGFGLLNYVRALLKQNWFPNVSDDGAIYYFQGSGKKPRGKQSVTLRLHLHKPDELTTHLYKYFPQGVMHVTNSPEERADRYKPQTGQLSIRSFFSSAQPASRTVSGWSKEAMEAAASEFEVPTCTKILVLLPEVFDRDILFQEEKYRHEYVDKNGDCQVGIKTPCPWCKTNKDVKYLTFNCRASDYMRTIAGYKEAIPIICFQMSCHNSQCTGNPAKITGDSSDNLKKKHF